MDMGALLVVGCLGYLQDYFWFEGVLFILLRDDFYFFAFLETFSVSGSAIRHIALLEGVCWNITSLCEHAQCADAR